MNKILFIIGILCFLVPFGLQKADERAKKNLIGTYERNVKELDTEETEGSLKEAYAYNEKLFAFQNAVTNIDLTKGDYGLGYTSQLQLSETGMIGYVKIPKIDANLPIYHGTSKEVLAAGIGHLEGTSLPVGGENTHSVLTGHCGLPNAELFTRLDELEKGDKFTIQIYEEILEYRVTDIQVVDPESVNEIKIHPQKDLVTLVTCTPYGINTHRLLVTGERIERMYVTESEENSDDKKSMVVIGSSVMVLFFAGIWWRTSAGNKASGRNRYGICYYENRKKQSRNMGTFESISRE